MGQIISIFICLEFSHKVHPLWRQSDAEFPRLGFPFSSKFTISAAGEMPFRCHDICDAVGECGHEPRKTQYTNYNSYVDLWNVVRFDNCNMHNMISCCVWYYSTRFIYYIYIYCDMYYILWQAGQDAAWAASPTRACDAKPWWRWGSKCPRPDALVENVGNESNLERISYDSMMFKDFSRIAWGFSMTFKDPWFSGIFDDVLVIFWKSLWILWICC